MTKPCPSHIEAYSPKETCEVATIKTCVHSLKQEVTMPNPNNWVAKATPTRLSHLNLNLVE